MLYLVIPILALLGYWEYKRTHPASGGASPGGTGPGGKGTPEQIAAAKAAAAALIPSPEQIVMAEAPSLAPQILDLLRKGRDPTSMDKVAMEMEKPNARFYNSARLLHLRADELRRFINIRGPVVAVPTTPGTVATPARGPGGLTPVSSTLKGTPVMPPPGSTIEPAPPPGPEPGVPVLSPAEGTPVLSAAQGNRFPFPGTV